jgi:outer membrane protein OmpA-like peptidoglycan-associated protein
MKSTTLLTALLLFSVISYSQTDKPDCKNIEPSYLGRMKGFFIHSCTSSEYMTHEFFYHGFDGKSVRLKKNGDFRRINYRKIKNEPRAVSGDQIRLNYANAVKKINGKSLSDRNNFFSFTNNGDEVFMAIENADDTDDIDYNVVIVIVKSMKQEVEFTFREGIDKDGKVAVYDILFDIGKSDIKPESAESLKQITSYLNDNPAVKIIIAGHTDNTGTLEGNMTLSKARAESIKNYLVANGKIAASRLVSVGVGQACPVSTNDSEEGRKLNRRVEIVKQ